MSLLGAGLTKLAAPEFPCQGQLTLFTRVAIQSSELGEMEHNLTIRLMDEDGGNVLGRGISMDFRTPPESRTHRPTFLNLAMGMQFQIPRPGYFDFICLLDQQERRRFSLRWILRAPPGSEERTG